MARDDTMARGGARMRNRRSFCNAIAQARGATTMMAARRIEVATGTANRLTAGGFPAGGGPPGGLALPPGGGAPCSEVRCEKQV